MGHRVLLLHDNGDLRTALAERLAGDGFEVVGEQDTGIPDPHLLKTPIDLAILGPSGSAKHRGGLLSELRAHWPDAPILLLGSPPPASPGEFVSLQGGVQAVAAPTDPEGLLEVARRALEQSQDGRDARNRYGLHKILAKSAKMNSLLTLLRDVARTDVATILLRGESGTGKDLIARALHYESDRAKRPFVTVMCTALQETLLENDLFGHEKGAYTDAKDRKKGLFEMAEGGSIFLNEIGDMGPGLQSKLLRVLDEQTFCRVGGTVDIRVDVRIIAATNRDLEKAIQNGTFRADLFYRLNIFPLVIPPLRDRLDDVPVLAQHFLDLVCRRYGLPPSRISAEGLQRLQAYDWPGNVRELRNVIERACLVAKDPTIQADHLQFWRMGAEPSKQATIDLPPGGVNLDRVEKDLIIQALARSRGNQSLAAGLLGITRYRLRSRLKKFGIPSGRSPEERT
jgi:DNA-binding NtrC family response regulator